MHQSQIELIVGCPVESGCGQWIECKICLPQGDRFVFQADLCCRAGEDDFSLYRVEEEIRLPLTAELVLGLLHLVAKPPFRPSEAGLSISFAGENPSANRAALRMLEPEIRASSRGADVPRRLRQNIIKKLAGLAKYREMQRLVLTPGSFD